MLQDEQNDWNLTRMSPGVFDLSFLLKKTGSDQITTRTTLLK